MPDFYQVSMLAITSSQIFPVVFGTLFIVAGMLIAIFSLRLRNLTAAAQSWPGVRGKIVTSSIEDRRRPKTGTHYFISVIYSYQVGNQELTGNKIGFGGTVQYRSRSDAEARLSRDYPAGREATVYYNPENRRQAVINRTPTKWWVGLFPATVFIMAGIVVAAQAFR